jgi:nucleotide-binding universal stress UspA family protein
MADEKDRYGDKIRVLGKVRQDQWAAGNDRLLMAKVRAKTAASESSGGPDKRSQARIFKNILCAIDFEDSSLKALRLARQIALQNDSTVHLIHVRQTMAVPMGGVVTNPPLVGAAARARLRELAAEHLDGINHQEVVGTGDPAKVLLKTADQLKADLIVMGTHGRRGVSHFLLGSVAEKTLRKAPCPVLTARGK